MTKLILPPNEPCPIQFIAMLFTLKAQVVYFCHNRSRSTPLCAASFQLKTAKVLTLTRMTRLVPIKRAYGGGLQKKKKRRVTQCLAERHRSLNDMILYDNTAGPWHYVRLLRSKF